MVPRVDVDHVVTIALVCGTLADADPRLSVRSVQRLVPVGRDPLRSSLEHVLLGATPAEAALGYSSIFSSYTAHALRLIEVKGGTARLDLASAALANPEADAASYRDLFVREQLSATLFQFPDIQAYVVTLNGGHPYCFGENCHGTAETITRP